MLNVASSEPLPSPSSTVFVWVAVVSLMLKILSPSALPIRRKSSSVPLLVAFELLTAPKSCTLTL